MSVYFYKISGESDAFTEQWVASRKSRASQSVSLDTEFSRAPTDSETNKIKWNSIAWDATSNINDEWYTENDDKAKAKYDRLQKQIQNQDKKLELELDNIETQRSAVTTEIDSVKKVIDDNIEGSFKTFA